MVDTRVLHGFVARAGGLALWAETDGHLASAARHRGRARPHPFAVPADQLAGWLPTVSARPPGMLMLPSTATRPLPSPDLGRAAASRAGPRLRPWLVPAVQAGPGADLADLADGIPGCRLGASAAHLAQLTDFARDLVTRGRLLPVLNGDGPDARARWRPVITGADAARLGALGRAMPPACRAERAPGDVAALPPVDAVRAALNDLVDGIARDRLRQRGVQLGPPDGGNPAFGDQDGAVAGWLVALTGDARVGAAPGDLRELARRLAAWQDDVLRPAPVRTCFRLRAADTEETEKGDDPAWDVELHLQPLDDPSVLVPADAVWRDDQAPLRRWTHHPQELLLRDLARASRLWPGLAAVLRQHRPTTLRLDTAGAYRFLTHAAVLEQAGFGVLLPATWRQPAELGLALEVRTPQAVTAVLRDDSVGLDAAAAYRWRLALGGTPLTEEELAELAAVKVPLVRLRGQWVCLDSDRLAAGLAFLAAGATGTMPAGQALRLAGWPSDGRLPLPVTATGGSGWLADLLAGAAAVHLELLDPPAGFVGSLRPYQRRGLSWLAFLDRLGLGACLADDMGLGKTVQLLALEAHNRRDAGRAPTLIVTPLSVLGTWQREAARFVPGLRVRVHHGSDRRAHEAFAGCDLVLTTYATVTRDVDTLARLGPWDRIVLDEAQHIKNAASAVSRAVRRLPARHRVALTGTPVENRLIELWSILDFLNPGMLGSAHRFRARYAVPIERHSDEPAAEQLRRRTRPFLLRRVKTDPRVAPDLPDRRELRHLCSLTAEQVTLYQAVLDDMLGALRGTTGIGRESVVLAAMTKLKQVCNHPAHLLGDGSPLPGRSGKLDRLEEILDQIIAAGDRALCFTQFARFGALLTPHLAARFGVPVRYLHGATPKAARDAMVAEFAADGRPGIFVLSLKAGGTGINLTNANHVVHVDRWWNPATEAQATDRAHRIGQDRDVQVHTLLCLGTLEERIDRMIRDKAVLAERVVGTGEGWLTRLSTAELRDVLALAPEAVGD